MRSPFQPRTRDSHPALTQTETRELAILAARIKKAITLSTLILDADPDFDPTHLRPDDPVWDQAMVLAGIASISPATKLLTILTLQAVYEHGQRLGLHAEGEDCIEYVQGNCEPMDVWPR